MNPWWSNPEILTSNRPRIRELRNAVESGIEPRMIAVLKRWMQRVKEREGYGVRVIRGPRRVGKTTLIYLAMRKALLELGYDPGALVYLTLDHDPLRRILNDISLYDILRRVIEERLTEYGYTAIFLDEVTFYPEWALALKRLLDDNTIDYGVLVVATGSYAVELSNAKSALEGRPGELDDNVIQRFYYPLRFSEVFESEFRDRARDIYRMEYKGAKLSRSHARLALFEDLVLGSYSELNKALQTLKRLRDLVYEDALRALTEVYLRTGGFPGAVYELRRTGRVSDSYYRGYYNLVISDATKFGLDESIVRDLLVILVRRVGAAGTTNIHTISRSVVVEHVKCDKGSYRHLKPSEARTYLKYVTEDIYAYFKLYAVPSTIDPQHDKRIDFKLVVVDPLIYASLQALAEGGPSNIEETIVARISDWIYQKDQRVGPILEAIACSNWVRLLLVKYGEISDSYGYLVRRGEKGETLAEVDCVVWYLDKKGARIVLPLEVKHRLDESRICAQARKAVEAGLLPRRSRLIVATLDEEVRIINCKAANVIHIPLSILLLLI